MLLSELPEALLAALRSAQVSSWGGHARVRAVGAPARIMRAGCLASLTAHPLSTRELRAWLEHYQGAQREQRDRMVEHPRLFIDSLKERERERGRDAQRRSA